MTTTTPDPQVITANTPIKNGKQWYMCNLKNYTISPNVCVECRPILAENWEHHKRRNPHATFYSVPNFVPKGFVPMFIRQQMNLQVEIEE
jgi:hypothetical protein